MRSALRRGLGVLVLSLLWAGSAAAVPTLYGVTGDGAATPESLYVLDQSDASASFQATLGSGDDGEALAWNPDDGLLYHFSGQGFQNDTANGEILERVHPNSLAVTSILLSGDDYNEALAATYLGSGLFLVVDGQNRLFEVSTAGVVSQRMDGGSPVVLDHDAKGLAFSGGVLYSVDRDTEFLRTLDPSDGSTLSSVAIDFTDVNGATGLAANPDTGELWALLKIDFQTERQLVRLGSDGSTLDVGGTGDRFASIAFVPEPGSAGLLAFALTGLALRRRRTGGRP